MQEPGGNGGVSDTANAKSSSAAGSLQSTSHANPQSVVLIPNPSGHPDDPLNWSHRRKATLLFVVCFASWAGTLAPPAGQLAYLPQVQLYHRTPTELTYSISAAVAGLLAGPIFIVPLSHSLGRISIIFWSLVGTLATQIWAALMTSPGDYRAFIVSRLFAGLCGSSPAILGSGIIMDIFFLHQRGRAFACYELSLLLGVIVSPTIGGFIAQTHPWPVAFWWTLIPIGLAICLVFTFGEDTRFERFRAPPLISKAPLPFWRDRVAVLLPGSRTSLGVKKRGIRQAFVLPFRIGTAPITLITGLYMMISFGFTVMLAILLTIYLQTPVKAGGYGFSPLQNAAFTFVSWLTVIVAQLVSFAMSDSLPLWVARRFNRGVWRPEFRLWNMWLPTVVAPIGLAIIAVTLNFHLHYMVLALGTFLVNTAAQLSVPLLLNYVVECYIIYAVEVAVAMNIWRLVFALVVGFFVEPWTEAVGRGWLFGMAALFVLGASLFTTILAWKGHELRAKYTLMALNVTEDGQKVT